MLMVRRYPVINHWTLDQLKVRELKEIANWGFGTPSATLKSVNEVGRGSTLVSNINFVFDIVHDRCVKYFDIGKNCSKLSQIVII